MNMAVYTIVDITVKEENSYAKCVERVAQIVESHGGRYLVRGGAVTPMSGDWNPERVILIEFATMDDWRRCFSSPEYRQIAPFRETSTTTRAIVVEGCGSSLAEKDGV
jgi:uncharacterized protein (DUF1330 family)